MRRARPRRRWRSITVAASSRPISHTTPVGPRHSQSATPSVATPTAGGAPDADRATTSGSDRRRGGRRHSHRDSHRQSRTPVRDDIAERVRHTIGVAGVGQTATQARRQLQTLIGGAQQDRAAVRTGVRLVERSDQRLGDEVRKENSLCYRGVVQQRRLRAYQASSANLENCRTWEPFHCCLEDCITEPCIC